MIIKKQDIERWKKNTLDIARDLSLDEDILRMLKETHIQIIPRDSGSMFYGWAYREPPRIEVYRTNPSKYFPKALQEVWNQSGMDHELIGHIYNFYAGLQDDESGARKTQVNMARHRGKDSSLWRVTGIAGGILSKILINGK